MQRARTFVALLVAVTVAVVVGVTAAARADVATPLEVYQAPPAGGSWALDGLGYGHGRGMSQWGAHGAATLGIGYQQILATYYPDTALTTVADQTIRVWVSRDDGLLQVPAQFAAGLAVTAGSTQLVLPEKLGDCVVTRWQVRKDTDGLHLEGLACGAWVAQPVGGQTAVPGPVRFDTSTGVVRTVLGTGAGEYLRDYRGSLTALVNSKGTYRTVNTLGIEHYLRSVVAWEMSASWPADALRAQSVAARTYATWEIARPGDVSTSTPAGTFDICDSTACQAYRGVADYKLDGTRTGTYEFAATDGAVTATAAMLLMYGGKPAFTQYGAANGGRTVAATDQTTYPYLREQDDPWDGTVANSGHSWTTTVTAAAVEKKWPAVGTVTKLAVVSRTGAGAWSGRVVSVRVDGTAGSVTVPGDTFRSGLGLKSTWWRAHSAPAAPTALKATTPGPGAASLTWAPPQFAGNDAVTGYVVWRDGVQVGTPTEPRIDLTGVTSGQHTVAVAAVNSRGTGPAATTQVTVGAGPPGAPPQLAASAARGVVTLTWGRPPAGSAPITGYTAEVGSTSVAVGATTTKAAFAARPPGTYVTRVTAHSADGDSPAATGQVVVAVYPTVAAPRTVVSGKSAALRLSGLAPGSPAQVQVMPHGTSAWAAGPRLTASASGTATAAVTVRTTTQVRVVSGRAVSPVAKVVATVTPALTLTSPAKGRVTASVTLNPKLAGVTVRLYRVNSDGSRTLLATQRTAGNGVARATFTGLRSARTLRVVAVPVPAAGRTGVTSSVVAVRVR